MPKRIFMALTAAAAGLVLAAPGAQAKDRRPDKPNIIVMLWDDYGRDVAELYNDSTGSDPFGATAPDAQSSHARGSRGDLQNRLGDAAMHDDARDSDHRHAALANGHRPSDLRGQHAARRRSGIAL